MHRIDGAGATVDNKFTQGNPVTAVPATTVTDAWLNDVQEEVASVPEAVGIPLVKGQLQLVPALAKLSGRVVDSIAALKALDKTKFARAFVVSYYGDGAGGGGMYWYDSTDTTTADNGGMVIVAADGGRWKLARIHAVSVKQFGARGDGSSDDTAAINAAIVALNAGAIKSLYFPAGQYLVNGALTVITASGVCLFGDGPRQSVIVQTANADALRFESTTPATTQTADITVRDLGINQTAASPTGGQALRLTRVTRGYFDNLDIRNVFGGILIEGGNDLHFDALTVSGSPTWSALAANSNLLTIQNYVGTTELPSEIFFSNFNIKGAGPAPMHLATCVTIKCGDGIWFDTGHLGFSYNTPVFLNPQPDAALSLMNVEFSSVYVDGNLAGNPASSGVSLAGSSLPTVRHIKFNGCTIKNFDGNGMNFDLATLRDLRLVGNVIADNGGGGLIVTGCDEIVVADNTVRGNNINAAVNDAIALTGVNSGTITGNLILAGASAHARGLNCVGSSSDLVVSNNAFQGHTVDMLFTGSSRVTFGGNRKVGSDPTVVASDGFTLPFGYDIVEVTGSATLSNISAPNIAGYRVTLKFTGATTVNDSVGNIKLNGGFVSTPDSTLSLLNTGSGWTETARAVV